MTKKVVRLVEGKLVAFESEEAAKKPQRQEGFAAEIQTQKKLEGDNAIPARRSGDISFERTYRWPGYPCQPTHNSAVPRHLMMRCCKKGPLAGLFFLYTFDPSLR